MWMTNQQPYVPNWSVYPASGDVDAANAMLDAAGWVRGSDGVRAKGGVKLAFTIGTTPDNQARELSQQIIQAQMKKLGIEFTIKNSSDILWRKMPGFDLPDDHLRLGRLARPLRQQRDLAVDLDPAALHAEAGHRRTSATRRA